MHAKINIGYVRAEATITLPVYPVTDEQRCIARSLPRARLEYANDFIARRHTQRLQRADTSHFSRRFAAAALHCSRLAAERIAPAPLKSQLIIRESRNNQIWSVFAYLRERTTVRDVQFASVPGARSEFRFDYTNVLRISSA